MCAIITVCGISQGDSQPCEMCCSLHCKVIRRCAHEGTIEKLYNHTISQISIEHYLYMLTRLARSLINLTASGKNTGYWLSLTHGIVIPAPIMFKGKGIKMHVL